MELNKKWLFSEAIIIGIFTLLGYGCAYLFERSYLGYYKISTEFITLDITKIFLPISGVLISFFILLKTLDFFGRTKFFNKNNDLTARIIFTSIFLVYLLCKILIFGHQYEEWKIPALLFLTIVFKLFIYPIFTNKGSYLEKIKLDDEKDDKKNIFTKKIIDFSKNNLGTTGMFIILVIVLSLFISNDLGKILPATRTKYTTVNFNEEKYILIRTYKDFLIVKKVDGQKLEDNTTLFKLDDIHKDGVVLKNETINLLQVL